MSATATGDWIERSGARPTSAPERSATRPHPCWIDFVHMSGSRLVLYGWVLGLENSVAQATAQLGDLSIDLLSQAIRVVRPDVSKHFAGEGGFWNDAHGFYVLIDLPAQKAPSDNEYHGYMQLSVTLHSGDIARSRWEVSRSSSGDPEALKPHAAVIDSLLKLLPPAEAQRLLEVTLHTTQVRLEPAEAVAIHPRLRSELDLCCLLENRLLLVCGWLLDPGAELTAARLSCGSGQYDLLANAVRTPRADVLAAHAANAAGPYSPAPPGFLFVHDLASDAHGEVKLVATSKSGDFRLSAPLCRAAGESRQRLLSYLDKLDPDAAITLILLVLAALRHSTDEQTLAGMLMSLCDRLARRLPLSVSHTQPRYALHVDQAIAVAEQGVFLVGWCEAESASIATISCHCGGASVDIGERWVRHPRSDVTAFLNAAGVQCAGNDHGYSCFVPLPGTTGPYFIAITLTSGEVSRVAVNLSTERKTALQAVRSILSSFCSTDPELLRLLGGHVGPAVSTLWQTRERQRVQPLVRRYGPEPTASPPLSIIVPLFGRHDLAEYQLALFADDPQIQAAELIYIVDDPSIMREFSALCADLYCIYQVPFTVVDPGSNLGFAGANNCAARIARGNHLLLLNSDVLPKRPGWAGEMLQLYRSLPDTGLLGAKLLYEDGSVQHAGIEFCRYADWADLWINSHPFKGQSPVGLSGVQAADAVTAACVLVQTALFRELGGFSEDYIIGDFEDSDLCLKARERGRVNRVALDIELYHLERLSQSRIGDNIWRTNLTVYNCWLHNSRWGELIERERP